MAARGMRDTAAREARESAQEAERLRIMTPEQARGMAQEIAGNLIDTGALLHAHNRQEVTRALEAAVDAGLTRGNHLNTTNEERVLNSIELGAGTGPFYEAAIERARQARTQADFVRISSALSAFNQGYSFQTHNWPVRVALKSGNDAFTNFVVVHGMNGSGLNDEALDVVAGLTIDVEGDADEDAHGEDFRPENRARSVERSLGDRELQETFNAFLARANNELRTRVQEARTHNNPNLAHDLEFMRRRITRIEISNVMDRIQQDVDQHGMGDMIEVTDTEGSNGPSAPRRRPPQQR